MMIITPFIPAQNFAERLPPTCKELDDVRAKANKYLLSSGCVHSARLAREAFQDVSAGYQDLVRCPAAASARQLESCATFIFKTVAELFAR
jgi:hypothetical protein